METLLTLILHPESITRVPDLKVSHIHNDTIVMYTKDVFVENRGKVYRTLQVTRLEDAISFKILKTIPKFK